MPARKKRCDPKRAAACRKAWETRRRLAAERAEKLAKAARKGWRTRRAKARRKAREAAERAVRAKAGHKKRKAKPIPPIPKGFHIPARVFVKVEPRPEVLRAPEVLTQDQLDAMIADFAKRRIHPDLWARDLAYEYDLEVGPLYKEYFDIVSPR